MRFQQYTQVNTRFNATIVWHCNISDVYNILELLLFHKLRSIVIV